MDPLLVVTAIRAAIRIGGTTVDAVEQHARERPILIPDVELTDIDDTIVEIRELAHEIHEFGDLLANDPLLKKLWKDGNVTAVPGATETVYAVALRFKTMADGDTAQPSAQAAKEIAGGMLVAQWAKGKGPVRPWTRVVVAMADVALEYVGSNPQILGIGGNGEKLIGAVAAGIAAAIPDDDSLQSLGAKDRFAERLAALVLSSGLKTLVESPDLVFSEEHLQTLMKNTLPPLIDGLPEIQAGGSVSEQVEWRNLTEALVGPAIGAALGTLAESPAAFLGKSFAADKAAGVMVTGLLNAAKDIDVKDRFSDEALFSLFHAATKVAAENPELILGDIFNTELLDPDDRSDAETVAVNLFKSIAITLKNRRPPFGDDLGVAVAISAIEGLKASGPALFNAENPWDKVSGEITGQILDGFAETLGDGRKALKDTVFSKGRLVDLARVLVTQVAETPHMLITSDGEVRRIAAAVAGAMAKDDKLLLTADDWIKIAGVAAQEAAINPGRLFGLNDTSLNGTIASDIIGRLLKTAGDDLVREDRTVGPVMIGETLRESIIVTLRSIGGNVEQALERRAALESLAATLNDVVAKHGLTMGGKEWLRLFRVLLPDVLDKGEIPILDDSKIELLLAA